MFLCEKKIKLLKLVLFIFFICFHSPIQAQSINERYDPKLSELNSLEKINIYIDSLLLAKNISNSPSQEAFIISKVIEDRFYHGISYYSLQDNFLAYLAGKYVWTHLSVIVVPDDILKYQEALCSQQAIVMMEVLKQRGFPVRKLVLTNHFILEAYFDNEWRVFDPDKEPTFQGFSHNSIMQHLQNGDLKRSYKTMKESEVNYMYKTVQVGQTNEFPAKNAWLFQIITKFISQYIVVFLTFLLLSIWMVIRFNRKAIRKIGKVKSNFKKVSECQQKALAD